MVRIVAHHNKELQKQEWLNELAHQASENRERKERERMEQKLNNPSPVLDMSPMKSGRRTLDAITKLQSQKPSDPKRYHAEKSRPPITPTPPPTDFFWEGRANSNIRHRRIISHTSTQESRSPLPPKGIPPKPSNPFSRTKTTLCTEDPDYDQRIEANLEWKAELEKQIEEKRKRERFEKQRNELEESMNLAKVYREDFDQRQPTKNPPHHLKPHQNITWPCLDKGSETCKEIYTKKPKPSKIPRSNLKKRQAQHPEIKKNEKSNKNESKMESSVGGSDNIHVNPDVEPNQINQTADTEHQNETATENIQNPESAQKNIASLAERESGAKPEVDQVPNISRKTTIKPNNKNDTQKPKHRRQGTGGVVEQKVTEIEQRLQEQTKEEQRILAEKLAHQKLNQQKANQKKMLRDEHNRVQLPSINEQGSISTPRSRKPSKGESVSRKVTIKATPQPQSNPTYLKPQLSVKKSFNESHPKPYQRTNRNDTHEMQQLMREKSLEQLEALQKILNQKKKQHS